MIVIRTPLRISFSGGGSDFPDFYKKGESGLVVSTTINKYIYVTVNKNFAGGVNLRYSEKEFVKHRDDLKHGIVRECMRMAGIDKGIEIVIISDVPSRGTGLGSSSALTAGLLKALYAYQGKELDVLTLAHLACKVEIDILKSPIGKQDQFSASFGGFNSYEFKPNGDVIIENLENSASAKTLKWLKDSLMLFYIGNNEKANDVLCRKRTDDIGYQLTKAIRNLAKDTVSWLKNGASNEVFSEILSLGYAYKLESGCGAVSSDFGMYYKAAIEAGALAGKPTGASGGFMLLLCEADKKDGVRRALDGLKEVAFEFEKEGAKIIYAG